MSNTLILDDSDQQDIPAADRVLMVAIYNKLQEHYPGHPWRVTADHEQGYAAVLLQYFAGLPRYSDKFGFRLFTSTLNSDPDLRSVVRAGGELLERFGLSRHVYRVDDDTRLRALEHGLDLTR